MYIKKKGGGRRMQTVLPQVPFSPPVRGRGKEGGGLFFEKGYKKKSKKNVLKKRNSNLRFLMK